jgi:hypothetical protein
MGFAPMCLVPLQEAVAALYFVLPNFSYLF